MELYIEIDNSKLLIAKVKEKNHKYYIFDIQETKLNNLEIIKNYIFNFSAIFLNIKNYLNKNKIKKTSAIICLPNIKEKNLETEFLILQSSLLISKLNIKIKKIIGSKILKKDTNMPYKFFFMKTELSEQLDFFQKLKPPKKPNTKSWIFLTLFLSISYTLFFYKTHKEKMLELENLTEANIKRSNKVINLNTQIKKNHELKTENNILSKKIEKLSKSKELSNNPLELLVYISKSIPANCKLRTINIGKDKTNNKNIKNKRKIQLQATTTSQNEINNFLNKLKNYPKLTKSKIINIQKVINNAENNEYVFNITCKLKSL